MPRRPRLSRLLPRRTYHGRSLFPSGSAVVCLHVADGRWAAAPATILRCKSFEKFNTRPLPALPVSLESRPALRPFLLLLRWRMAHRPCEMPAARSPRRLPALCAACCVMCAGCLLAPLTQNAKRKTAPPPNPNRPEQRTTDNGQRTTDNGQRTTDLRYIYKQIKQRKIRPAQAHY
jgi:hypothetical protein